MISAANNIHVTSPMMDPGMNRTTERANNAPANVAPPEAEGKGADVAAARAHGYGGYVDSDDYYEHETSHTLLKLLIRINIMHRRIQMQNPPLEKNE